MPMLSVPPRSSRTSVTASRASASAASTRSASGRKASPASVRTTPRPTRAKLDAELGLERAHLLGERGLGEVERPGGAAERAVLGRGEEVGELLQSHRRVLWKFKRTRLALPLGRPYRESHVVPSHPSASVLLCLVAGASFALQPVLVRLAFDGGATVVGGRRPLRPRRRPCSRCSRAGDRRRTGGTLAGAVRARADRSTGSRPASSSRRSSGSTSRSPRS